MEKPRVKSTSGPPALPPRTVFNVDVKSLVKAFAEKSQESNQSRPKAPPAPSRNSNPTNNSNPAKSLDQKNIQEQTTANGNDSERNGKVTQPQTAPPPAPPLPDMPPPPPENPVPVTETPKPDPIINVQNAPEEQQAPPTQDPEPSYAITRPKHGSRIPLSLSMQRRPSEVEISTTLSAMKELIEQRSQIINLHQYTNLNRSAPSKRSLPVPRSRPPKPPVKPPSLASIPRLPSEAVIQKSPQESLSQEKKQEDEQKQITNESQKQDLQSDTKEPTKEETQTDQQNPAVSPSSPPESTTTSEITNNNSTTISKSESPAEATSTENINEAQPTTAPRKSSRPLPVPPPRKGSNGSLSPSSGNRNRSSSLPQQSTAPKRELPRLPEKRIKSLLSATGSTSDAQVLATEPPTSPRPPSSPRPPTETSPEQPMEKPLPSEPQPESPVNIPATSPDTTTQTWYQYLTEEGYTYYYNNDTNETTWELPGASEGNTNVWEISKTEEDSYYYYNLSTFQSTWQLPASAILIDRSYVYSVNSAPATTSSESSDADIQKKMNYQRRKVIEELIDTERAYVTDLRFIDQKYLKPLRSQNTLSEEDTQKLFCNILTILSVNTELLMGLEGISMQQLNDAEFFEGATQIITDVFEKMCPSLRSYADYAANQMVALETIDKLKKSNKQFNDFLKKVKALPESRDLRLDAFLVKPIQRLCKYPLLFRELIKSTPQSEAGHSRLKGVAELLEGVAMYANEFKRTVENARKLEHIDKILGSSKKFSVATVPGRMYLMEGKCTVATNGKHSKEYLFLMSDCVLFCESQTSLSTKKKRYTFRRMLPLDEYIKVDYLNLNEDSEFYFNLIDMNGAATESGYLTYTLCPDSDCKKWFSTLQKILQEKQQPQTLTDHIIPLSSSSTPSSPLISIKKTDSSLFASYSSMDPSSPMGTPVTLRARSASTTPESRRRSRSLSPTKAEEVMRSTLPNYVRPSTGSKPQSFRQRKGSTETAMRKAFYSTMETQSSTNLRSSDGNLTSSPPNTPPLNTFMLAELKGRFRSSSQGIIPPQ